jgi:deoxycytidylate deaminase
LILTDIIVSIDKDTGVGAVIADGKVVSLGCAGANKAVLVGHSSSCVAVEDTLVEVGSRFEEVIEEGSGGIQRDVRVGKTGRAVVVGGARDQGEKLESDQ